MSNKTKIRLVCISDTHNKAPGEGYNLPKGDVLVHAGDITNQGSYHELKKAAEWLEKADFAVKIVVAGAYDHIRIVPEHAANNSLQVIMIYLSTRSITWETRRQRRSPVAESL